METLNEQVNMLLGSVSEETWTRISKYQLASDYTDDEGPIEVIGRDISDTSEEISVEGEQNSQYINFVMPRYYDGIDIVDMTINVHYEYSDGMGSNDYPVNAYYSDEHIKFGWIIPQAALLESGSIFVCIFAVGTQGDRNYIFKTKPKEYIVYNGLNITTGIPEPDENWYLEFVIRLEGITDDLIAEAKEIVDEYAGQSFNIDPSLDISSAHAIQNKAVTKGVLESYDLVSDTVGYNARNFNKTKYSDRVDNGVTFIVNADGSISISGETDGTNDALCGRSNFFYDGPDALFILSGGYNDKIYLYPWCITDNDRCWKDFNKTEKQTGNAYGNTEVTILLEHGKEYCMILRVSKSTGQVPNNVIVKPFLRKVDDIVSTYSIVRKKIVDYIEDVIKETVGFVKKNLFVYPYLQSDKTQNGITFTDMGDGTIKVNGTCSGGNAYFILVGQDKKTFFYPLINKFVKLSGGISNNIRLQFWNDTYGSIVDYGYGVSFKFTEEFYNLSQYNFAISILEGTVVNNVIVKPILSNVENYSNQYQSIEDSNNFVMSEKKNSIVGSQNLSPFPYWEGYSKVKNGITLTVDKNGIITLNGTTTDTVIFDMSKAYILPNGKYKVALKVISGTRSTTSENSTKVSFRIGHKDNSWWVEGSDVSLGSYNKYFTINDTVDNDSCITTRLNVEDNGTHTTYTNYKVACVIIPDEIGNMDYVPFAATNKQVTDLLGGSVLGSPLPFYVANNLPVLFRNITYNYYYGSLKSEIAAGDFRNVRPGDYIIGQVTGTKYFVVDLNFWFRRGDKGNVEENPGAYTNHLCIMPFKLLTSGSMTPLWQGYTTASGSTVISEENTGMCPWNADTDVDPTSATAHGTNSTNITRNSKSAYLGSFVKTYAVDNRFYNDWLKQDFGVDNIIKFRNRLTNAIDTTKISSAYSGWTGASSGFESIDSYCDLPSVSNILGFSVTSSIRDDIGITRQFSLFKQVLPCCMELFQRTSFFTKNILSSSLIAIIDLAGGGDISSQDAGTVSWVCPFALIK